MQTTIFKATDGNGTRLKIVERSPSPWQKELRISASGYALNHRGIGRIPDGSKSTGSFPIKSPQELVDLLEQVTEFLEDASLQKKIFSLGPHGRSAGTLIREVLGEGKIYWKGLEKGYRDDLKVEIDYALLEDLRNAAGQYAVADES